MARGFFQPSLQGIKTLCVQTTDDSQTMHDSFSPEGTSLCSSLLVRPCTLSTAAPEYLSCTWIGLAYVRVRGVCEWEDEDISTYNFY